MNEQSEQHVYLKMCFYHCQNLDSCQSAQVNALLAPALVALGDSFRSPTCLHTIKKLWPLRPSLRFSFAQTSLFWTKQGSMEGPCWLLFVSMVGYLQRELWKHYWGWGVGVGGAGGNCGSTEPGRGSAFWFWDECRGRARLRFSLK